MFTCIFYYVALTTASVTRTLFSMRCLYFFFFPLLTKAALRFHVQMKSLTTKNPYPPILFRELQILLDHSDQSRTETKIPRSLDQR